MYLALFHDAMSTEEVSSAGYSRVPIRPDMFVPDEYRRHVLVSNVDVRFPQAVEDWNVVASVGVFDQCTGGKLISKGYMWRPTSVMATDTIFVSRGNIQLTNFVWPSE